MKNSELKAEQVKLSIISKLIHKHVDFLDELAIVSKKENDREIKRWIKKYADFLLGFLSGVLEHTNFQVKSIGDTFDSIPQERTMIFSIINKINRIKIIHSKKKHHSSDELDELRDDINMVVKDMADLQDLIENNVKLFRSYPNQFKKST